MEDLFKRSEYLDFRIQVYQGLKKDLEKRMEELQETRKPRLHPLDGAEETIVDGTQIHCTYDKTSFSLPFRLLSAPLSSVLTPDILTRFTPDEMQQLCAFAPNKSIEGVLYALEGQGFCSSILQQFSRKLNCGYFCVFREKQDEIQSLIDTARLRDIYENTLRTVERGSTREALITEEEGSSLESLQDLSCVEQLSEGSQATETEELPVDIEEAVARRVFFPYDGGRVRTQQEVLALGEERTERRTQSKQPPARPKNQEWVENYRRQELQRYMNPTKPWMYTCEDGRKVTVAPVAKKITVAGKPREHPLLKNERPACVTILTLVRDAAARLPNGVGTRSDISDLLKQSQYVNEDLMEDKLSNIVSGALDRLHYLPDACVKFDSEKKLWLYLHCDRNHQHPAWGEDGQWETEKPRRRRHLYDD